MSCIGRHGCHEAPRLVAFAVRLRRLGVDLPRHPRRAPGLPAVLARGRCASSSPERLSTPSRAGEGSACPAAREWGSALFTGALFFVVGNGLVNVAEQSVSSGLASVLVATMPLWVTIFGRLLGARVSKGELAGVVLGLVGVVVLNLGGELRASPGGAVCALLAPMGWALGSVASRRLPLPGG